ncbi:MAG: hypothetical protein WKF47_06225 [Geodermatophilaceae bacterium]
MSCLRTANNFIIFDDKQDPQRLLRQSADLTPDQRGHHTPAGIPATNRSWA